MRKEWRFWTALALAILASACTPESLDDQLGSGETGPDEADATSTTEADQLPSLGLSVRPGPFQLSVDSTDDLAPGTMLQAIDTEGMVLAMSVAAEDGSALLRDMAPGEVRIVRLDDTGEPEAATPLLGVPDDGAVDASIYEGYRHDATTLESGFAYIPTRDGTLLSAFVSLPGPADRGPYPTLVEYSGYGPSQPDTNDPGRLLITTLGYALVQVNLRGTGCSGGSFDAFEPVQGADGYDVIETVAAQDWSASVGMYGVSYAGIMQLQVAATRPPSLAAIAPLSVIDDIGSVLFPGGIYNDGFAESWTRRVSEGAEAYGQGWEQEQVDAGDETCASNQAFRVHNPDLIERIQSQPYVTELSIARSPVTYASQIDVPVFLAGAFHDEQTGGRWPALIDELSGAPTLRVTLFNGLHGDSVAPELLTAVTEFYDLFLNDPSPGADPLSTLAIGAGLASFYGEILPVSFNNFDPDDAPELRAAYTEADRIRVLFELGADRPNLPVSSFAATFASWPPESVGAQAYPLSAASDGLAILGPGDDASSTPGDASFVTDPDDGALTTASSEERAYSNDPRWEWPAAGSDNRITASTAPFEDDLVLIGPASAELWVSADAADADIEVTISEIAPDGSETYVQNGWLRLSRRALDASATELRPAISGLEADVEPLTPNGEPVLARVEVLPFAHIFRAGSSLQLTIDTPGASRPEWRFAVAEEPAEVTIHIGPDTPSQLILPVLPALAAPSDRPDCGTLRGQPCRPG